MTQWTSDEITKIAAVDEMQIMSVRNDGTLHKPVVIWVVRVGDDLYVRSANGRTAAWFRGALLRHEGHIRAGGVDKDVSFEEITDAGLNDQIDAAYLAKYQRYQPYVKPMVTPEGACGNDQTGPALKYCVIHRHGSLRDVTLEEHKPMSWDEAFSSRYEEWSANMTADVAFYVALAVEADGPLVELAIGNGRVAIPVAQATGRRVIGIDSSPAMLEQARRRVADAGVELELIEGKMQDLALDEPAALIYCPYRALLHLPTWADRRRTFERVAASLRPSGRFAWNAFVFDHRSAMRLDGTRQEERVPHTIRYAVGDNRIDLILDNGAKSSLWWATKNEWLGLIDVAGLQLEALYGGFAKEPFGDDSREYVFVARR